MTREQQLALFKLWNAVEYLMKELEVEQRKRRSHRYYETKAIHESLQEGHRDFLASGGNAQ